MVIEQLTFDVAPEELERWLSREAEVWDRRLAAHPGFLGKEVWQPAGEPRTVHVVVWWASYEAWRAVPGRVVEDGDGDMGALYREPAMQEHRVLRRVMR